MALSAARIMIAGPALVFPIPTNGTIAVLATWVVLTPDQTGYRSTTLPTLMATPGCVEKVRVGSLQTNLPMETTAMAIRNALLIAVIRIPMGTDIA